jgi:hypothetical protein
LIVKEELIFGQNLLKPIKQQKKMTMAKFQHTLIGSLSMLKWTLVLAYLVITSSPIFASKVYNIHWNSSNPIFRIDKTDNVIDVNAGNHPSEYDQVNIVCPVHKANLNEAQQERYIIYLVSKEEFKSCRITQPNPRVIAVCNRPYDFMYFTITFRSFTPTPGGLEFHPGQDYYFISTSSTNDLHRRVGGGCSTKNMRLIFKVADGDKNKIENTEENDLSIDPEIETNQVKTQYHPWRLPSTIKQNPKIQTSRLEPAVNIETSTVTTYYYPLQELERANELSNNPARPRNVNFNIYRGARKAFTMSSASDLGELEIQISSGVMMHQATLSHHLLFCLSVLVLLLLQLFQLK